MSSPFVKYDAVTHDEYLRKWREQHDLCVAFFDEDRAERHLDHEPARAPLPLPTPAQSREAPASVHGRTARGPRDLPEAA